MMISDDEVYAEAVRSFGSCEGAIHEAMDILETHNVRVDYMRVRSFP